MSDDNGLYYMRARYYNIDIKRFINQDVITGSIDSSPSLNRYAYVEGNPVSYLDPFGLNAWDTSFIHETLEFFASWFSYVSVISAIGGILFAPTSTLLYGITTIASIISGFLSCVNAVVYLWDAHKAESEDECYEAIVNAITDGVTGVLGIVSPISKICEDNHLVSDQAKAATDWLLGYIIDTFGEIAGYYTR